MGQGGIGQVTHVGFSNVLSSHNLNLLHLMKTKFMGKIGEVEKSGQKCKKKDLSA